jgi:hypothetical protein
MVLLSVMTEIDTPLNIVRYELWRGSDRNPSHAGAVMDMIHQAVDTFGDEASDFTKSLIESLDPRSPKGLGARNAAHIESLGILVQNEKAAPVERWGALSLLGALAVTHHPDLSEDSLLRDRSLRSSHLPGYIARYVLYNLQLSETTHSNIAEALLRHTDVPPEDAAIEFVDLGLRRKSHVESEPNSVVQSQEADSPVFGSSIGEPYHLSIDPDSITRTKIRDMDWLKNPDLLDGDARDIFHDGKKIATIIDLTTGHSLLDSLHKELKEHPQGPQIWPRLAIAITQYTITKRAKQLKTAKVTTFYARNMGSDDTLVRAFYTPLGRDLEGFQLFGLIAATRTKHRESQAFDILCANNNQKISSR